MYMVKCSVSGLGDKDCKAQVKNALDKIKGVQDIGVNLTTSTIEVKYDEPATANEIKHCIESTGFKIVYE